LGAKKRAVALLLVRLTLLKQHGRIGRLREPFQQLSHEPCLPRPAATQHLPRQVEIINSENLGGLHLRCRPRHCRRLSRFTVVFP